MDSEIEKVRDRFLAFEGICAFQRLGLEPLAQSALQALHENTAFNSDECDVITSRNQDIWGDASPSVQLSQLSAPLWRKRPRVVSEDVRHSFLDADGSSGSRNFPIPVDNKEVSGVFADIHGEQLDLDYKVTKRRKFCHFSSPKDLGPSGTRSDVSTTEKQPHLKGPVALAIQAALQRLDAGLSQETLCTTAKASNSQKPRIGSRRGVLLRPLLRCGTDDGNSDDPRPRRAFEFREQQVQNAAQSSEAQCKGVPIILQDLAERILDYTTGIVTEAFPQRTVIELCKYLSQMSRHRRAELEWRFHLSEGPHILHRLRNRRHNYRGRDFRKILEEAWYGKHFVRLLAPRLNVYGHQYLESENVHGRVSPARVYHVRYDPRGSYFLTAGDDGALKVWDASTARLCYCIRRHVHDIRDVGISDCGQYVLSCCSGNQVKLWQLKGLTWQFLGSYQTTALPAFSQFLPSPGPPPWSESLKHIVVPEDPSYVLMDSRLAMKPHDSCCSPSNDSRTPFLIIATDAGELVIVDTERFQTEATRMSHSRQSSSSSASFMSPASGSQSNSRSGNRSGSRGGPRSRLSLPLARHRPSSFFNVGMLDDDDDDETPPLLAWRRNRRGGSNKLLGYIQSESESSSPVDNRSPPGSIPGADAGSLNINLGDYVCRAMDVSKYIAKPSPIGWEIYVALGLEPATTMLSRTVYLDPPAEVVEAVVLLPPTDGGVLENCAQRSSLSSLTASPNVGAGSPTSRIDSTSPRVASNNSPMALVVCRLKFGYKQDSSFLDDSLQRPKSDSPLPNSPRGEGSDFAAAQRPRKRKFILGYDLISLKAPTRSHGPDATDVLFSANGLRLLVASNSSCTAALWTLDNLFQQTERTYHDDLCGVRPVASFPKILVLRIREKLLSRQYKVYHHPLSSPRPREVSGRAGLTSSGPAYQSLGNNSSSEFGTVITAIAWCSNDSFCIVGGSVFRLSGKNTQIDKCVTKETEIALFEASTGMRLISILDHRQINRNISFIRVHPRASHIVAIGTYGGTVLVCDFSVSNVKRFLDELEFVMNSSAEDAVPYSLSSTPSSSRPLSSETLAGASFNAKARPSVTLKERHKEASASKITAKRPTQTKASGHSPDFNPQTREFNTLLTSTGAVPDVLKPFVRKAYQMPQACFLDGHWSAQGDVFVATRTDGMFTVFSACEASTLRAAGRCKDSYSLTPVEQFFDNDFRALVINPRGAAVCEFSGLQAECLRRGPAVDALRAPLWQQPPLPVAIRGVDDRLMRAVSDVELKLLAEGRIELSKIVKEENLRRTDDHGIPTLVSQAAAPRTRIRADESETLTRDNAGDTGVVALNPSRPQFPRRFGTILSAVFDVDGDTDSSWVESDEELADATPVNHRGISDSIESSRPVVEISGSSEEGTANDSSISRPFQELCAPGAVVGPTNRRFSRNHRVVSSDESQDNEDPSEYWRFWAAHPDVLGRFRSIVEAAAIDPVQGQTVAQLDPGDVLRCRAAVSCALSATASGSTRYLDHGVPLSRLRVVRAVGLLLQNSNLIHCLDFHAREQLFQEFMSASRAHRLLQRRLRRGDSSDGGDAEVIDESSDETAFSDVYETPIARNNREPDRRSEEDSLSNYESSVSISNSSTENSASGQRNRRSHRVSRRSRDPRQSTKQPPKKKSSRKKPRRLMSGADEVSSLNDANSGDVAADSELTYVTFDEWDPHRGSLSTLSKLHLVDAEYGKYNRELLLQQFFGFILRLQFEERWEELYRVLNPTISAQTSLDKAAKPDSFGTNSLAVLLRTLLQNFPFNTLKKHVSDMVSPVEALCSVCKHTGTVIEGAHVNALLFTFSETTLECSSPLEAMRKVFTQATLNQAQSNVLPSVLGNCDLPQLSNVDALCAPRAKATLTAPPLCGPFTLAGCNAVHDGHHSDINIDASSSSTMPDRGRANSGFGFIHKRCFEVSFTASEVIDGQRRLLAPVAEVFDAQLRSCKTLSTKCSVCGFVGGQIICRRCGAQFHDPCSREVWISAASSIEPKRRLFPDPVKGQRTYTCPKAACSRSLKSLEPWMTGSVFASPAGIAGRNWLLAKERHRGDYVPQLGDVIRLFPSEMSDEMLLQLALTSPCLLKLPADVAVVNIDFTFPHVGNLTEIKRNESALNIETVLSLLVLPPHPAMGRLFLLTYRPLVDKLPLVLTSQVLEGIHRDFTAGDRYQMFIDGKFHDAIVVTSTPRLDARDAIRFLGDLDSDSLAAWENNGDKSPRHQALISAWRRAVAAAGFSAGLSAVAIRWASEGETAENGNAETLQRSQPVSSTDINDRRHRLASVSSNKSSAEAEESNSQDDGTSSASSAPRRSLRRPVCSNRIKSKVKNPLVTRSKGKREVGRPKRRLSAIELPVKTTPEESSTSGTDSVQSAATVIRYHAWEVFATASPVKAMTLSDVLEKHRRKSLPSVPDMPPAMGGREKMDPEFQKAALAALEEIFTKPVMHVTLRNRSHSDREKKYGNFLQPIPFPKEAVMKEDEEEQDWVTAYWSEVPLPIDLSLIKGRVENDFYRSSVAFLFDLQLLYDNSVAFNGPDAALTREARAMIAELVLLIRDRLRDASLEASSNKVNSEDDVKLKKRSSPRLCATSNGNRRSRFQLSSTLPPSHKTRR